MVRNIIIALVVAVSVSLITFFIWSTAPVNPSTYDWQGEILGDVQKLTITEINSLDTECQSCRDIHRAIMDGVSATGDKVDYRFRILIKPSSFSPEDPAIITSYNTNDIIAYCLSPQVGLVSEATFHSFLTLAFENNSEYALENIFLLPKHRQQINDCIKVVGGNEQTLIGKYLSQSEHFRQLSSPLVLLQAPGVAPVVVQSSIDNINSIFETIQNDPEIVLRGLSNQLE